MVIITFNLVLFLKLFIFLCLQDKMSYSVVQPHTQIDFSASISQALELQM